MPINVENISKVNHKAEALRQFSGILYLCLASGVCIMKELQVEFAIGRNNVDNNGSFVPVACNIEGNEGFARINLPVAVDFQ